MSRGPRGAVVLARVSSAPPTLCQAAFLLSFSPSPAVRTELLDLALHYASMEREREKKKSDHEIGLKFSVYIWCPAALCFQMKMSCTTEESYEVLSEGPGVKWKRDARVSAAASCRVDCGGMYPLST